MDYFWFLLNGMALVILGGITTFTDVKEGKIRNKHVLIGIIFAIISNLFYFGKYSYLILVLLGIAAGFFMGFMIWYGGLWTAGDSKLFIAYTAIISGVMTGENALFIPFLILINSVTPIFFIYFFLIIKNTNKTEKIKALKKALYPKMILYMSIFIFSFTWILEFITRYISILSNYFFTIILLFLIFKVMRILFKNRIMIPAVIISILRILLDFSNIYNISFLTSFITILIGFIFIRIFILNLGKGVFSTKVKIKDLKPGMLITNPVEKKGEKYVVDNEVDSSFVSLLQKKSKKYFLKNNPCGLTEKEIKKLHELENQKKLKFDHLPIHQTIPFAPILFTGAIITFIIGENIFIYLLNLLVT